MNSQKKVGVYWSKQNRTWSLYTKNKVYSGYKSVVLFDVLPVVRNSYGKHIKDQTGQAYLHGYLAYEFQEIRNALNVNKSRGTRVICLEFDSKIKQGAKWVYQKSGRKFKGSQVAICRPDGSIEVSEF